MALWERFGVDPGEEPGQYESLAAMADGAHLIIEAVVDTVKPGRVFGEGEGAFRSMHLVLKPKDVFKGNVAEGQTVTMGLGLAELDVDIAARYGDLAGDEGIFFLIPTWAPQPEFGIGDYPPDKGLDIYRPVNSQGVFIRDGSMVAVPLYLDDQYFPTQFRGMPFDEFEQRVETAAAESA